MKGIIFNLLEEVVRHEFGEDVWDGLLETTQLNGTYTSLGSYPDAEMLQLLGATSAVLNKPTGAVLRWFGAAAIPLLAAKYPVFFKGHTSARPFLLTVNEVIHKEVRKVYPGADVPVFGYGTNAEGDLVMTYTSARKLCHLAEGFIQGAAAYYGEEVIVNQLECMIEGGDRCVLHICLRKREE